MNVLIQGQGQETVVLLPGLGNLPVIFFLQPDSTAIEGWSTLHEEQIKDSAHGKVMTFEGTHYLHHTKSKEIVENFRAFMEEVKKDK
ncbi:hypothetical protein D3C73_840320 [compost metagenome]